MDGIAHLHPAVPQKTRQGLSIERGRSTTERMRNLGEKGPVQLAFKEVGEKCLGPQNYNLVKDHSIRGMYSRDSDTKRAIKNL